MYAITESSYRAVSEGMALAPGEALVEAVPVTVMTRIRAEQMKADRRQRLRATDWTQMADAPLTALEKTAYQTYRQALRDLPSVPGFPDVPWPVIPPTSNEAAGEDGGVYIPITGG